MQLIVLMIDSLRYDTAREYFATTLDSLPFDLQWVEQYFACSLPTVPARTDLWTGRRTFLERSGGGIDRNETTVFHRLSDAGHRTILLTDNHIIVDGLIGGNFQSGFGAWRFVRGHESDAWSYGPPDAELREAIDDRLVRDVGCWEQFRRNARLLKEHGGTARRLEHEFRRALGEVHETSFCIWIDIFLLHEPWFWPGALGALDPAVLFPAYGRVGDRTDLVPLIVQSYQQQARRTLDWVVESLLTISENACPTADILLLSDHGFYLGEHDLIGKPKDEPAFPILARVPCLATARVREHLSTSATAFQPQAVWRMLHCLGGCSGNLGRGVSELVLWGRNGPSVRHVQLMHQFESGVALGRNGAGSFEWSSDSAIRSLGHTDAQHKVTDAVANTCDLSPNESQWLAQFMDIPDGSERRQRERRS